MKTKFTIILFAITLLLLNYNCTSADKKEKSRQLKQTASYKIKVAEPSGLALTTDKKNLWAVSDQNSTAYMLTLDGKIVKSIKVAAPDLEGIAVINDTTIVVVSEITGEFIFVGYSGKEIKRAKTSYAEKKNVGLEAITYDVKSKHIFLVKEKNPGLLIELNNKLKEISAKELKFASDYSGLDFVPDTNELWIISDENKSIYRCETNGTIKESYKININQAEGIAVDSSGKKVYVVSDREEKLYVFEIK